MSTSRYCAFENTASDMSVCCEKIEDMSLYDWEDMFAEEAQAGRVLYKRAKRYIEAYEDIHGVPK